MTDLDDFELDKTQDGSVEGADAPKSVGRLAAIVAAAGLLVAVASTILWLAVGRPAAKTTPSPEASPTPVAEPSPSSNPLVALPRLDESDGLIRELAKGLSAHSQLSAWLANPSLVRTFVAIVSNVAEGDQPTPHLSFLAPKRGLSVSSKGGRLVIDPKSYQRYDAFADAVASLDAAGCARVYRLVEPLAEAAYRDLGHPAGGFSKVLEGGIAELLDTPAQDGDVPVVRNVLYEFANRRLEDLQPPKKQFLRMGPGNMRKIQAKLREFAQALGFRTPPAVVPGRPVP